MEIFPAQYSTLSTKALKEHLQKKYGLEGLSCRLLSRNVSDTYLVEHAEGKCVFRVYRRSYRTLDEIKGEMQLLNILKSGGIPVSSPIPDLEGEEIQSFHAAEGVRYGVLFSFAEGKVIFDPDDEQLFIIGQNIARMHDITSICQLQYARIVYDTNTTLVRPLELIKHRFAGLDHEYTFLQNLAARVMQHLDLIDTSTFTYGYCHYDLLPKNFHFDSANNLTFFDFDWAGKGWLINDLMTFYVQLFFLVHFNAFSKAEADRKMTRVISGYRQVRNLSDAELDMIPWLGVMFWLYGFGFYEQNYDDFAISFLTPRFIRERVALIEKWVKWYNL